MMQDGDDQEVLCIEEHWTGREGYKRFREGLREAGVMDALDEVLDRRNRERPIPFLRIRPRHWKASISY